MKRTFFNSLKAPALTVAVALAVGVLGVTAADRLSNNPPASLKLADQNEGPNPGTR